MTNIWYLFKAWRRVRKIEREHIVEEYAKLIKGEHDEVLKQKFEEFKEDKLNYGIIQDFVNKAAEGIKVTITLPNRQVIVIEQDSWEKIRQQRAEARAAQRALADAELEKETFI